MHAKKEINTPLNKLTITRILQHLSEPPMIVTFKFHTKNLRFQPALLIDECCEHSTPLKMLGSFSTSVNNVMGPVLGDFWA